MKMLFVLSFATLALGCATTSPAYSRDTAQQLDADRRYAHASDGQVILGPSTVNEVVTGQKDVVGNVHTDPIEQPEDLHNY